MSMYGKDHEYAHSRLHETIVRRGDVPIYVYSVRVGMVVEYSVLSDIGKGDEPGRCPIDELDLQPVPLGYCNYNKNAIYLQRMPMRRDWRQGLRRGNFTCTGNGDPNRIPYESIAQTIIGDYPTFKASLNAVVKLKSVAWARFWSINSALQVFYKGGINPVGRVEDSEVVLEPSYTYLREALKESL